MATSTIIKGVDPAGNTHLYEERRDASANNRTYYGRNETLGASQTAATWQIYAEDRIGTTFYRTFAFSSDAFAFQWSARTTYFAAAAFLNQYSLQFTGAVNCYGIVPHNATVDFANSAAFSGSLWIKSTSTAVQTYFQKTSAGTGNNGYVFEIDGSQRLLFTHRGVSAADSIQLRTATIASLAGGSWKHIAWTKATGLLASGVKIYVDGVSQALTTVQNGLTGSTNNALPLNVGANFTGAGRFIGNMDEASLWNVELTGAEITEIYNSNAGVIDLEAGSGQIASGLVSWWRMGDGEFVAIPTIPDDKGTNDMTTQAGITTGDIESEVAP